MKIKDLTPNLILHYMVMALRPGPFADELAMRPPLGMQELRKRASMFIRVEEIRHYQDRVRTTPTHLEAKRGGREPGGRDQNRLKDRKQARFSNYAPP